MGELPYGVSGFYNSDEPKPPEMDVNRYKELCSELARKLDGELLEFIDSLYPANFHKAHFTLPTKNICLVMNKHYPLLAFANTVEEMKIEFIDYAEGTKAVPEEYKVLTAEALEAKVPENFAELPGNKMNKGEIEQINYWKPGTVGEIVYNFWD